MVIMNINGQHFHTIWTEIKQRPTLHVIDQTKLPFELFIKSLSTFTDCYDAIKQMVVRGAPLIGVTAAYGIWLGLENLTDAEDHEARLTTMFDKMKEARPTAVNLIYALNEMRTALNGIHKLNEAKTIALNRANELKQQEIENCKLIGEYGLEIIEEIYKRKQTTVNILTHCNAGWLACIDWGTALAPVYKAHRKGIPVHVWVDETRPRNQGSKLTAFELYQEGVPHTIIADNTGGHIMQHKLVDMVLVGSDCTTRTGDVCNKIGTYHKALAAADNNIPFYVALPTSSIDLTISDGINQIPIEQRSPDEMKFVEGKGGKVQICPDESNIANYGFDVTPSRFVTALITEKGVCKPTEKEITRLFY
jgi:methylthioribose-1-phosphate isomerase